MSQVTFTTPIANSVPEGVAKPLIPHLGFSGVDKGYTVFEIGTPKLRTSWTVINAYLNAETQTRKSGEIPGIGKAVWQLEVGLGISGIPNITEIFQFKLPPEVGLETFPQKAYLLDAFNGYEVPPGHTLQLILGAILTPPIIPTPAEINFGLKLINAFAVTTIDQRFPSKYGQ